MNYKRLIPILLLKDGLLVRSQLFRHHQAIGDPIPTIKRLTDWSVDEIILLNIGSSDLLDSRRSDKWHNIKLSKFPSLVSEASHHCFAPLSIGGGIRTLEDFKSLFTAGADKCVVNTALFDNPALIKKATNIYGAQSIVASIDIFKDLHGNIKVMKNCGKKETGLSITEAIKHAISLNIGELLISSINYDGSALGYDPEIYQNIPKNIGIPVIINSGATESEHFEKALKFSSIDATAASNVFYFKELSYPILKAKLIEKCCKLRKSNLSNHLIGREPTYDNERRKKLLSKNDPNSFVDYSKYDGRFKVTAKFCKNCLYSSLSASPTEFADDGICMGCKVAQVKYAFTKKDYSDKKSELDLILKSLKVSEKGSNYDCIIPVSGGKDSYYQTHYVVNELKLKPLLVTYNGNNYSDVGFRNLMRMKECFDCDHLIINPSIKVLKKLNKLAFIVMGDMNWHNHVGILTCAAKLAVQMKIPLVFWGEHGYADLCGQFSMQDYPEMDYRTRLEHSARGFEWNFFVGLDGLSSYDMNCWKYPSDQELIDLGLRQIYLGHYIHWDANDHIALMVDKFGFEVSDKPFERTYRRGSNLDDIHENGVHDYLKYIKFGYGRCTDHASKDIRSGVLSRREGIKRVNMMDSIKPRDLKRWLEYVDMTEDEFDRIADHFRDPRVWVWNNKGWERDQISIDD